MIRHFFKNFACCPLRQLFISRCHLSTVTNFNYDLFHDFEVDEGYYRNEANQQKILQNLQLRDMKDDFPQLFRDNLSTDDLSRELIVLAKQLPNSFHPIW